MGTKNTYEYVYNYIQERGCELLDNEYLTQDEYLNIKFSCGHIDKRNFAHFKSGANICARCSGKRQYKYQEVYDYFSEYGYELLSDEYFDCKKKLIFRDVEGYKYCLTFDQFKHGIIKRNILPDKFNKGNSCSIENVEWFLLNNFSKLRLFGEQKWLGNNKKLNFYDVHGYKYSLRFDAIQLYYSPNNSFPPIAEPSNLFAIENIERWIEINNPPFHLLKDQKYKDSRDKLLYKCHNCHIDEIPFEKDWVSIQQFGGCPYCHCTIIANYNNLKYVFPEIANMWDYKKNYPKLPEQVAPHTDDKYWWVCDDCENSYFSSVAHKTGGEPRGCPFCSESNGEKRIRKFLEKIYATNEIYNFDSQVRFDECKDLLCLPFDFQIFINNGLYFLCEYHGIQHYKSIKHFGGDIEFQKRLRRDKIKSDYCLNNNIPLIIIPYTEFNNIESILTYELGL